MDKEDFIYSLEEEINNDISLNISYDELKERILNFEKEIEENEIKKKVIAIFIDNFIQEIEENIKKGFKKKLNSFEKGYIQASTSIVKTLKVKKENL